MRPILALPLALAAAACGGGGSATYASAPSAACLRNAGAEVTHSVDFVASTALGGSFKATFPDNFVTVSFGKSAEDADNIADAYRRFSAANVGVEDVLRQQGNAVMLWHLHPSDADSARVTGCLKS
jgi:hypothetical protein